MKKDLIFSPALLLVGVALFLLRYTGMAAHIAVSVVGLALLVVYAVLTKKDWRIPALEVITRVFYGIALITGIVILNVADVVALALIHKISAVLFMVLMVALLVSKLTAEKEN